MNIREKQEQTEMELLSPYATQSIRTKGRKKPEVECEIRTCFQRDRDRIVHCKAFRRLKDKTQVFLSPVGDHYRTRLMHTLEVSQNARTIARALDLNETLTEAIALGHDLGHTPFGHAGERVLNEMNPAGFKHNEQSVRVAQCLEKNGQGLNLTWEVLDGMKNHSMHSMPHTLEGKIVRLADKIAYINHDIDDSVRAKVLREEDLPKEFTEVLGTTYRERINTMVLDIVKHSENLNDIVMSKEVRDAMIGLRKFMFERVYEEPNTKKEEDKIKNIIGPLYEYYLIHVEQLPEYNKKNLNHEALAQLESNLRRSILELSMTPDLSDERFAGNASGVAMQYKLWGIEQVRLAKERSFLDGLHRLLTALSGGFALLGTPVALEQGQVTFYKNLPQDHTALASTLLSLSPLLSKRTILEQLPWVKDAEEELRRKAEETMETEE